MPICLYRSGPNRTCKANVINQPVSQFLYTVPGKKIKFRIVKTCRTCRCFYAKKKEPFKKDKKGFLLLTPYHQLSFRTRQMMTDSRIKRE